MAKRFKKIWRIASFMLILVFLGREEKECQRCGTVRINIQGPFCPKSFLFCQREITLLFLGFY